MRQARSESDRGRESTAPHARLGRSCNGSAWRSAWGRARVALVVAGLLVALAAFLLAKPIGPVGKSGPSEEMASYRNGKAGLTRSLRTEAGGAMLARERSEPAKHAVRARQRAGVPAADASGIGGEGRAERSGGEAANETVSASATEARLGAASGGTTVARLFAAAAAGDLAEMERAATELRAAADGDALRALLDKATEPGGDVTVRRVSLDLLFELADEGCFSGIEGLATNRELPASLRCEAVCGLAALSRRRPGVRAACGAALATLLADAAPEVRSAAAQAVDGPMSACVAPALALALQDPSSEVRASAAAALARLGEVSAVESLVERAREDANPIELLAALGATRSPSAVPYLAGLAGTGQTEPRARSTAIDALGRIGDPASIAALARLLDDADERTAARAALALADVPSADARAALGIANAVRPWQDPDAERLFRLALSRLAAAEE
ncbi:MAG: HEAT repeat domain-containing protein [Planctomycetes bacterium]|nr:HEAT repeat domain-containing protein [Planctomycetota bacterium]